jgi:hypothetical protein
VAGTEARAGISVTFYNSRSVPSLGIDINAGVLDNESSDDSYFRYGGNAGSGMSYLYFTDGTAANDLTSTYSNPSATRDGVYIADNLFVYGAQGSMINYAQISFDTTNNVYEAVGKFDLTNPGAGLLVAVATLGPGSLVSLSLSDGAQAITDATPTPEPSSMLLGLLAMGASVCARRRPRAVRR